MAFEGAVLHHRAVMEEAIGRFLYPCEQVHHIDGDRGNNKIENLKLYATQRNHLLEEHSHSRLNDEELVKKVLEAADDPAVPLHALPCAPATARKILKHHGKDWTPVSSWKGCSEEELQDALVKVGKKGLPEFFGVSYQTIWRRFPHILAERKSANYLDAHK